MLIRDNGEEWTWKARIAQYVWFQKFVRLKVRGKRIRRQDPFLGYLQNTHLGYKRKSLTMRWLADEKAWVGLYIFVFSKINFGVLDISLVNTITLFSGVQHNG